MEEIFTDFDYYVHDSIQFNMSTDLTSAYRKSVEGYKQYWCKK